MSFNSSVLIAAVSVAITGAAIFLLVDQISIASWAVFAIGAISSGLVSAFIANKDESQVNTTTLYVGNLPYRANEGSVRELFAQHGQVVSVRLLRDKQTGKRRGFGFVEIATADSKKAISALNDFEFQERLLKVRLANEK